MNLKDQWIFELTKLFENLSFISLEMVDISINKTVARKKNSRDEYQLTGESILSFFEMIHFKYKNSFDYLSFDEMEIENNQELLPLIHHIVLKFIKLETFIFGRNEPLFIQEFTQTTQLEFKERYLA